MDSAKSDVGDSQQVANQTSYNINVIPVEFNQNRVYSDPNGDYLVEPYSRTHDDYSQTEESPGQGSLYSVSQRLTSLNQNQTVSHAGYGDQLKYSAKHIDWDKGETASGEINRECLVDDKHPKDDETRTNTYVITSTLRNDAFH